MNHTPSFSKYLTHLQLKQVTQYVLLSQGCNHLAMATCSIRRNAAKDFVSTSSRKAGCATVTIRIMIFHKKEPKDSSDRSLLWRGLLECDLRFYISHQENMMFLVMTDHIWNVIKSLKQTKQLKVRQLHQSCLSKCSRIFLKIKQRLLFSI